MRPDQSWGCADNIPLEMGTVILPVIGAGANPPLFAGEDAVLQGCQAGEQDEVLKAPNRSTDFKAPRPALNTTISGAARHQGRISAGERQESDHEQDFSKVRRVLA